MIYKNIYNHCHYLNTFRYISFHPLQLSFSYETKYKSSHTVSQEGKSKNSTHFHQNKVAVYGCEACSFTGIFLVSFSTSSCE